MARNIPPGYSRCEACGEFNGTTQARFLNWEPDPPESYGDVEFSAEQQAFLKEAKHEIAATVDPDLEIPVRCLCQGRLCQKCGVTRLHRPGSNSYEEETNSIGHWPGIMAMLPCSRCREGG